MSPALVWVFFFLAALKVLQFLAVQSEMGSQVTPPSQQL